MLRIHIAGTQVEDIADTLHHLCKLNGVFLGVAAELLLVYAEDALQREALAHCLPQCGEHLYHVAAAALYTLRAILIGTVVGDGREQLCHGVVPVAAIDGDHVKAQSLEILCLLCVVLDHGLQVFLGVGRGGLLGAAVHLCMEVAVSTCYAEVLMLGRGVFHGHGRHIRRRTACTLRTGTRAAGAAGCTRGHAHTALHVCGAHNVCTSLGAIEVNGVQQLTEVVLCIGIVQIEQVEVAGGIVQRTPHYGHGLLIEVVDGHQRSTILCTVCKVLDHLLGGVLLSALKEMGRRSGREHPVPEHHVADLDGAEQCTVFQFHNMFLSPLCGVYSSGSIPAASLCLMAFYSL